MSGEDEIIPWAYDNFNPNNFEDFVSWFNAISEDFENNGRSPLGEILEQSGIDALGEIWDRREEELSHRQIQKIIDRRQDE